MHTFALLDDKKTGKLNWPQVWNHLKEQAPAEVPEGDGEAEYDDEEAAE